MKKASCMIPRDAQWKCRTRSNRPAQPAWSPLAVLLVSFVLSTLIMISCDETKQERIVGGTGSIEAKEIRISPIMPARIDEIHFGEGDRFQKGDILVTLVSEEVRAGVDFSEAGIDAARRQVQQAKANLDNARSSYRRAQELFEAGAMSEQKFEKASTGYEVAKSAYNAARARVRQLQAGLVQAKNRLDEAYLTAPIDGIVLSQNFERGEVAMPGGAILTVADLSIVELRIYIPEPELYRVRPGLPARIHVDGLDRNLRGSVVHVADKAEFTPQNVQTDDARARLVFGVKIKIPNEEFILKPGMPVEAEILESAARNRPKNSSETNQEGSSHGSQSKD